MGKDRKKVGSAYVHMYRCTCMHVYMYVPVFVFVRESVRVCVSYDCGLVIGLGFNAPILLL